MAQALEHRTPADDKLLTKHFLAVLAERAPGSSVEVRVPPYAAAQVIAGVRHTRGTPPAVIETDAATWIALATGELDWHDAIAQRPDHRQRRAHRPDRLPAPDRQHLHRERRRDHERDRGLMDIRSLGFRTDLRLLEMTGSEIEDRGTHLVIRTPANPTYFWGNFLLLK